ncbi:alpha/beta fold hydrolase [Paeniglutamicibacter cryotolerans]|uniref:Pimeloyl-ACP methyl ester carboxylesterase n=1 Tax=Paeniglutamicibacter cryotolerans TaxID=670079 RepID=A0A839QHC4_9MICC|nr:alpha/beta hydrolase [Paeniglutamicibacter cryotolerans]MBB2995768.1 pimeloyl-ACP methyl ester carboxylesterase [Paeniglutamicibacter cryotolerans]
MPEAQINDVTLSYTDRSPESGSENVLLLLHGHAFDRSMWEPQIGHFAALGWRVIAPDLRGFGGSGLTPGIVYTEEFTADTVALLDHLGIDTAVVLGYSMGGQVAMEIQHSHPQRVRALAIVDTIPQGEDAAGKRRRNVVADRLVTEGMHDYAADVLGLMIGGYNVEKLPAVAGKVLEMIRASSAVGSAAAMRGRAARRDFSGTLSAVTVPALVVVGADDAFDGGAAVHMHELMPHSTLAVIEGAGHTPSMEQPASFNAVLQAFLSGV